MKYPFQIQTLESYEENGADKDEAEGFNSTLAKAIARVATDEIGDAVIVGRENDTIVAAVIGGVTLVAKAA